MSAQARKTLKDRPPASPGPSPDEYWRMFELVQGDIEKAIESNNAYLTIHDLARADPAVLAKYNRFADFWTLNAYALQTTFFIAFGRIFDERQDSFSIQKLVEATILNPAFFSKAALLERKQPSPRISGEDPP